MAEIKQPKKFKFTITALGKSIDIKNAPDGWSKTTVEFKRSATYFGVIRSLTIPFNFVFRAAGIIRTVDYTNGLMGIVKLLIQKLNPQNWTYLPVFSGKVDMTTIEDNKAFVTASVIEDSFQEKVAAFDGVKYEIKLNVPEAIEIELTPLPFKEKADMIFVQTETEATNDNYFPQINLINNEVHATIESAKAVIVEKTDTPDFATDQSYFYQASVDTKLSIQIRVFGLFPVFGSMESRLIIVDNTGDVLKVLYQAAVGSGTNPNPFDVSYNLSFDLVKDQKLFVYSQKISGTGGGVPIVGGGEINMSYNTETPPSKCNALRANYVFNELIQKMNGKDTGGAYTPYPSGSYLLTNTLNRIVITCSNSIRKIINGTQYNAGDNLLSGAKYSVINGAITYNSIDYNPGDVFTAVSGVDTFTTGADGSVILLQYEEVIVLAFKDFYQSVKSWMGGNVGFGIDANMAVLEEITYFFRNVSTLNLGKSINGFKSVPAVDQVFNSLKVGGEDQQYDTLNGFQEVNSTQFYTGDLTAIQKELDLVSPIRIDPYGIETLRFTPSDTSASRSDNDVWAIWIKEFPEDGQTFYHPLRNEELQSITGIDAGIKYYNWRLTPKNCVYRGAPYLSAVFNSQTTLRFTSALKNVNLVTVDLAGKRVAERDNVLVSDLGTPVFKPRYFKFNCKLPQDGLNQLNIMYTSITFNYRGTDFSGFQFETSVDVGQNSQRDFTLLSVPTNDLRKLIH